MSNPHSNCLNCNHPLQSDDKYCAACGQKTDAHLLTLGELVNTLWSSITNLDNSAFKTIKYIWAPWKLTRYYVEGKKKSFLNPIRIFLVTLIFHFGLLISTFDLSGDSFTKDLYTDYEQTKLYGQYLKAKTNIDTTKHQSLIVHLDTTLFKEGAEMLNDTLTHFTFKGKSFNFTAKDIIELNIDSIYIKYDFNTFIDKLIAKQLIKSFRDPDSTIKYILGNLLWAILLTILLLAAAFKLLYWRKKLTFVEHLIFLLNVHSLSFLVNSILFFFGNKMLDINDDTIQVNFTITYFLLPALIFIISLYKYYQQTIFKTLFKSTISFFIYVIVNLLFIFLTGFASFLLF